MSTVAVIAAAGSWLVLAGVVWGTVCVARPGILEQALDEVGPDDRERLEDVVRRRLGDAGTDREVDHVLKRLSHVQPSARA